MHLFQLRVNLNYLLIRNQRVKVKRITAELLQLQIKTSQKHVVREQLKTGFHLKYSQ